MRKHLHPLVSGEHTHGEVFGQGGFSHAALTAQQHGLAFREAAKSIAAFAAAAKENVVVIFCSAPRSSSSAASPVTYRASALKSSSVRGFSGSASNSTAATGEQLRDQVLARNAAFQVVFRFVHPQAVDLAGKPQADRLSFGELAVQQRFEGTSRAVVQHAGSHSHHGCLACGEQRIGYAAQFARAVPPCAVWQAESSTSSGR